MQLHAKYLYMQRYLTSLILKDLEEKLVLLSGPRQIGKTTLSKVLFPTDQVYLNFDRLSDRKMLREESWSRNVSLVVFDEIHKMKSWKRWLKGIYDTEGVRPRILVTGSARLDIYRKAGDSLAGRFFLYRLHPISVAEASRSFSAVSPDEILEKIIFLLPGITKLFLEIRLFQQPGLRPV